MARDLSAPPPGWEGKRGKGWADLTPAYRSQVWRAHERGYAGSIYKMTRARATGKLSETDQAARAAQRVTGARYVVGLGSGRWNFAATVTNGDRTPNLEGRARLQANMKRAARLDRNVTAVITSIDGDRYALGGRGGQSARSVLAYGEGDALEGLYALLAKVYGATDVEIADVSLFVFPVTRRNAA